MTHLRASPASFFKTSAQSFQSKRVDKIRSIGQAPTRGLAYCENLNFGNRNKRILQGKA